MSEQKRYTAQELRDAADTMDESIKEMEDGNSMYWREDHTTSEDWKAMLRQAADAEDEIAKLKARLEAVVMECEKQIPACRGEDRKCNPTDSGYCDENCHDEIIVHAAVAAILRVARGESETENK